MKYFKKNKEYIKKLKSTYWHAKSNYIKYYDNLPIQEKDILLEASHGNTFEGTIFYMVMYLAKTNSYKSYNIFLSASSSKNAKKYETILEDRLCENVNVVIIGSDKYYRIVASAKYLINDTTFLPFFIKKKGQIYLNTWHGTPLKTLGRRISRGFSVIGNVQKNFVMADYILFPNEYTKEHILEDYMLANICPSTKTICSTYPRNEILGDWEQSQRLRHKFELEDKRLYVYMPTWRDKPVKSKVSKYEAYLLYYLCELDNQLQDDEILFVKLHVLTSATIDLTKFTHIKSFPEDAETYEVLNMADVLITDYSSVLFDFAESRKKIVLFPFDKEDYFKDRGTYFPLEKLPFPQIFALEDLLLELRSEKNYDESLFLQKFSPFSSKDATKKLCDFVILQQNTGLIVNPIPDNRKENILIYTGNLSRNGITSSLVALMNIIDLERKNYILTFRQDIVQRNERQLYDFPSKINYFAIAGWFNLTPLQKIIRVLFERRRISAKIFAKILKKRLEENILRSYGGARIDTIISFNGYEDDIIMMYSVFKGKKYIYAHSDMIHEAKTRGIRMDVLRYAYSVYDKVLPVSGSIVNPMAGLLRHSKEIAVCRNLIDYKKILEYSELPITLEKESRCSIPFSLLKEKLSEHCPKFITVGRFSPEKGHERLIEAFCQIRKEQPDALLFIMGGNSYGNTYWRLLEMLEKRQLTDCIFLLLNISNPYPIIKSCDYFVLSSFYEGFGIVIAEADILGKPVISTNIEGPREFMQKYGGTLVKNSQEGIYQGMKMLLHEEVPRMNVDYEAYNRECINEFENAI